MHLPGDNLAWAIYAPPSRASEETVCRTAWLVQENLATGAANGHQHATECNTAATDLVQVQNLSRDAWQDLCVLPSMASNRDALQRTHGSCSPALLQPNMLCKDFWGAATQQASGVAAGMHLTCVHDQAQDAPQHCSTAGSPQHCRQRRCTQRLVQDAHYGQKCSHVGQPHRQGSKLHSAGGAVCSPGAGAARQRSPAH